jgi:hypothetical protein
MGLSSELGDALAPEEPRSQPFAEMPASSSLGYPAWSRLSEPLLVDRGGVDSLRDLPKTSREAIATVIRWFRENQDAAGDAVASYCVSVEPELRSRPQDYEITRLSAVAVIDRIISGLEAGQEPRTIPAPSEVLEYSRTFARRKMPLSAVQRSYHLGHAWFSHQWSVAMGALLSDAAQVRDAITSLSLYFFVYVDTVTSAIADEYVAELVRWTHSSDARRLRVVQEILNNSSTLSTEHVSRELDWSVTVPHVALLAWSTDPSGETKLDDFYRALAKDREHSVVRVRPDDSSELWMWLHVAAPLDAKFLDKRAAGRDINLAIGDPANGLDGFRRTFDQARRVRRLAALPTAPKKRTWLYRDHQLAVLAVADVSSAESFIRDQLGQLIADDEGTMTVRHAIEVFLDSEMNRVRAANALHVHRNTLAYRLDRAAELRGRPLTEEWVELATALNLLPFFVRSTDR